MFKVAICLGAISLVIAGVLADAAMGRPGIEHAGVAVPAAAARPHGPGQFARSVSGNRNVPGIRPERPAPRGLPTGFRSQSRSAGHSGKQMSARGRAAARRHVAYRPVPHSRSHDTGRQVAAKLQSSSHPTGHLFARQEARRGVGWVGRTFWPDAHSDIFGFALRPFAYDSTFWSSAYDEVFDNIFWPPSYSQTDNLGEAGRLGVEITQHERRGRGSTGISRGLVQTCDDRTAGLTDPSLERIERAIQPTGRQRLALDDLRTASAKAMDVLKASCPPDIPLTPLARLDVMQNRLAAMLNGLDIVRPTLLNFFETLSEEQRARLAASGPSNKGQASGDAASAGRSFRLPGWSSVRPDTPQFCGDEPVPKFAEVTVRRIEQVVQPTETQRVALRDLKDAASKATATLQAACPTDTPSTPTARLDAMEQRVRSMLDAIQTIRPALTSFYTLLSDEQKARFNTMSSQNTLSSEKN